MSLTKVRTFALILLILSSNLLAAQIDLNEFKISFNQDSEAKLEEVFSQLKNGEFDHYSGLIQEKYFPNPVWISFSVDELNSKLNIVEFKYPLDEIDLYHIRTDKVISHYAVGKTRERKIPYRNSMVYLDDKIEEGDIFLVRVKSSTALIVPIRILSNQQFDEEILIETLLLGLFYGATCLFTILAVILATLVPSKMTIFFSIFVFFSLLHLLKLNSYSFYLDNIFRTELFSHRDFLIFAGFFKQVAFLALSFSILGKKKYLQVIYFIPFLMGVSYFLQGYKVAIIAGMIGEVLISSTILFLFFIEWLKKKSKDLLIFLFSCTPYFIGIQLVVFKTFGFLKPSIFTNYGTQVGILFQIFLIGISIVWFFKETSESKQRALAKAKNLEIENSRKSAIVDLTQMLAHDIRKPFGLIKLFLMLLEDTEHPEDFTKIRNKAVKKISNAINSVNSMLADITDFGHDLNLDTSNASISNLFYSVFNELAQIYSHDISIKYQFHHVRLGLIDVERFKRVFSNIISNAIQAIASSNEAGKSGKADILIRTEDRGSQITVQIKNTGSFISKEDLPSVFDSFFTKGKSKGTGLGLAIAKKITEAHGGRISVDSLEEEQFVEFTLVLPSSDQLDPNPSPALPNSLAGYQDFIGLSKKQNVGPTVDRKSRESMIDIALKHAKKIQRKIRIGMLDDEDIYRQSMQSLITSHDLSDAIELIEYSDPKILLNGLQAANLDLLISDIDLSSAIDGYELVKTVSQKMGSNLPICMHSNKATFKDAEKGYESGASAFMPKPMTVDHLLKFVVESLKTGKKTE